MTRPLPDTVDAIATAIDSYAAANAGVLPAGAEPGDLGRLFDVLDPLASPAEVAAELATLLEHRPYDFAAPADDLAPVIAAARAYARTYPQPPEHPMPQPTTPIELLDQAVNEAHAFVTTTTGKIDDDTQALAVALLTDGVDVDEVRSAVDRLARRVGDAGARKMAGAARAWLAALDASTVTRPASHVVAALRTQLHAAVDQYRATYGMPAPATAGGRLFDAIAGGNVEAIAGSVADVRLLDRDVEPLADVLAAAERYVGAAAAEMAPDPGGDEPPVVGIGDPCPPGPHVHEDGAEGFTLGGDDAVSFIRGLLDAATGDDQAKPAARSARWAITWRSTHGAETTQVVGVMRSRIDEHGRFMVKVIHDGQLVAAFADVLAAVRTDVPDPASWVSPDSDGDASYDDVPSDDVAYDDDAKVDEAATYA